MSHYDTDSLYQLLPAVYRKRDADEGYPLRTLVGILAEEARLVERDIMQLHDNAFIETCSEWVVPYIADLVGLRPLPFGDLRRNEVANTLGARRRKGTAAVLEQLAADVTGWPARVVEYFQHLATSQFIDHPRPASHRTPDLRDAARCERIGGAFDDTPRTADVRRIATGRGRHNVGNLGLWAWRLGAYPLHLIQPLEVAAGQYSFSPLGLDQPLYHHPVTETAPTQIAGEIHVPEPIRRRQLAADTDGNYLGAGRSLAVYTLVGGEWTPVVTPIVSCDLSDPGGWTRPLPAGVIALDPECGRLAFGPGVRVPSPLRVSCHLGFSDSLGGGQYPRQVEDDDVEPTVVVGDAADPRIIATLDGLQLEATLADALVRVQDGWSDGQTRVIEIRDSRTYSEALGAVNVPANARLVIRAADQERPAVLLPGPFAVQAAAGSALALDGLLIAGDRIVVSGELNRLTISHSTLVPGHTVAADGTPGITGAVSLVLDCDTTEATVSSSIVGALWVASEAEMTLEDVIVDAHDPASSAYAGGDGNGYGGALTASRVTVIGSVATRAIPVGEDSLFLGTVTAERRQEGGVRYSWVTPASRVPRRYRCQPELPDDVSEVERARALARLTPRFTTLRYGQPAYAQLAARGPAEIRTGAADGSEMGAFSGLGQAHRTASLRQRLDEFLPVGLEAGILFAS
ncbi:MAG: hypothetical protein GY719_23100 [bacterium]|nr:hypothetical protein [bacterium]